MRFQLPSEVHFLIPDQSGNALLLVGEALGMMQSVLYMEPGQRLNPCAQIADHCLTFHAYLHPKCETVPRPRRSPFSPALPACLGTAADFAFY